MTLLIFLKFFSARSKTIGKGLKALAIIKSVSIFLSLNYVRRVNSYYTQQPRHVSLVMMTLTTPREGPKSMFGFEYIKMVLDIVPLSSFNNILVAS